VKDAATTPPSSDAGQRPVAGQLIDHFKVMRLLARGGMGEVYLARDTQLGRKVALKMVRPEHFGSDRAKERFIGEARMTARLSHPHIVTIHAVGEHGGMPYVALEYLEGQTLGQRMSDQRLSQPEAFRIMSAVAEAVAAAHATGILHLDLKPENVVIPADGRLRVLDFGLARKAEREESDGGARPDQPSEELVVGLTPGELAAQSQLVGTPEYMAPEQWLGLASGKTTDSWALGLMLFELCAEQLPFDVDDLRRLGLAVCNPSLEAPRLDSLVEVPEPINELVARCLAKLPDERPSATAIADVLRQQLGVRVARQDERSPFRGLLPFTERQADVFFGRDREIDAFVERTRLHPVLPVVGPSGAGKSSFVQAGVIPRLREQDRWTVLQLRPGARPFEALAARLRRRETTMESLPPPLESGARSLDGRTAALAAELLESPGELSLELRALAEEEQTKVLLLVDQLEELFTLVDDPDIHRAFMEAMCSAADDPSDPIRVIFTVRDDFLGRIVVGPAVREALTHVTVVQRLEADALQAIVTGPLKAVGYGLDDPTLVDDMVAAVMGEPAGLPLLQFATQLLWERRDKNSRLLLRSAYDRMGGVEGALARQADELLGGLTARQLDWARQLLLRLVTAERTRKILSTHKALDGLDDQAKEVLERLTQARLVSISRTREAGGTGALLELAHESLITTWATLSRWLDETKEEIGFLNEVGQAAELWVKRGRRIDELWGGDALDEALRSLARCTTEAPEEVRRFLEAARERRRHRLVRRRAIRWGGILALVAIATVAVVVALVVADKERVARLAQEQAERDRKEAEAGRAAALREGARVALAHGSILEARAKLREALESHDSSSARALWWQLDRQPLAWRLDLGTVGYSLDFTPDGRRLAIATDAGTVLLVDLLDKSIRTLRGHQDLVLGIAVSPSGERLVSSSASGPLRLWNTSDESAAGVLEGHENVVFDVAFSPDERLVASASEDRTVRLWNVAERREQAVLRGHEAGVWGVAFSADGKLVASGGADSTVRLWDVATGRQHKRLDAPGTRCVRTSPDGKLVASGGVDGKVRLFSLPTGKPAGVLSGHQAPVRGIDFSADGTWVVTAAQDGTVLSWDLATRKQRQSFDGNTAMVRGVAISPDGRWLATSNYENEVQLREVTRRAEKRRLKLSRSTWDLTFSSDGDQLLAGLNDGQVAAWDVETGTLAATVSAHETTVRGVAFSPDGKLLATCSQDGTTKLWRWADRAEIRELRGHTGTVMEVTFSPDGRLLATAGIDKSARLWDPESGQQKQLLQGHTGGLRRVRFSPDGLRIATSAADKTIRLWDRRTGRLTDTLTGHTAEVEALAFNPAGTQLVSGSFDKTLVLWNLQDGTRRELAKTPVRIGDVVFLPDGEWIGAYANDTTVGLWQGTDGRRREIETHYPGARLAVSPDGKLLATAGPATPVQLWQIADGRPFWRAPALLASPPRLLTHRGWQALSATSAPPLPDGPRQAVEEQARIVRQTGDGPLCLQTWNHEVQLWTVRETAPVRKLERKGPAQLVALPRGCLVSTGEAVHLLTEGGSKQLDSENEVTATGRWREGGLVASGRHLDIYDAEGRRTARRTIDVGARAVGQIGTAFAVGYRDGTIELLAERADGGAPAVSFERTPNSVPRKLLSGPMDTLIVGYLSGDVGIWSLADGSRLAHAQLHGAVAHLLLEDGKLYAASELGDHLVWDLRQLRRDYCELMDEIWKRVPVVWAEGRAIVRPPPETHRCRQHPE